MSRLRVNKLTNKNNDGAPEFIHGASVTGVVTATAFKGDGSELTGVSADTNILNSGVPSGSASSINFGNNISVDSVANGVASLSVSVPPGLSVKENGQTPIDAVSSLSFDPTGFTVTNSASGEAFVQNSAGVGINSTGTSIATNVNTLNFVGAGNTFSYDSANNTVNISIASGGGGSAGGSDLTTYAEDNFNTDGYNTATYMYSLFRAAGGLKGNTFFWGMVQYKNSVTRYMVYPFTVDRTTGAITKHSENQVWYNGSYGSYSTTYHHTVDGTGAVFSGGHNPYPGYSSHKFGYTRYVVDSNGSVHGGTYSYSNADHGYNGAYTALPTSENSGKMISGGYSANNSSRAHNRIHTVSGTSISSSGINMFGSDTSTTYGINMVASPGVYQSGNQVVSLLYFRYSDSDYRVRAVSANGNTSDAQVDGWSSQARAYQLDDGTVILFSSAHQPMKFTSYNNYQTLNSHGGSWPGSSLGYMPNYDFGIGGGEFIFGLDNNTPFKLGVPFIRAKLTDSSWTYTGIGSIPEHLKLGYTNNYSGMIPLYSSSSASLPDKLLMHDQGSSGKTLSMKVIDFPTFTDI